MFRLIHQFCALQAELLSLAREAISAASACEETPPCAYNTLFEYHLIILSSVYPIDNANIH